MTRTAVIPTTGDPYCCAAFLECYKRYWKSEVDTLRVFINCEMSDDLMDYVVHIFKEEGAIVVGVKRSRCGHGEPLDALIASATEDYIYITEDDFYLSKKGLVHFWFRLVESKTTDAIGSKRGCTSQEIIQLEARQFNLTGLECQQPNFWPCLYVGTRESLQKVGRSFGPHCWKAGDIIQELNYTIPANVAGDTFVDASIALRGQGLRFHQVPQNRIIDVFNARNLNPEWIHVGSCSSSLQYLMNENLVPLGHLSSNGKQPSDAVSRQYPPIPDQGILALYEEKAALWSLLRDRFPIPSSFSASWMNDMWGGAVERFTTNLSLRPNEIKIKRNYLESALSPLWR